MNMDQFGGEGTVIGAALSHMDIAFLDGADNSPHWSKRNHAPLKKHFAPLFYQGGIAEGQGTIVVDSEGRQYAVKSMDELIRVWKHARISHCFDMNPEAYDRIRGKITFHAFPELETA